MLVNLFIDNIEKYCGRSEILTNICYILDLRIENRPSTRSPDAFLVQGFSAFRALRGLVRYPLCKFKYGQFSDLLLIFSNFS